MDKKFFEVLLGGVGSWAYEEVQRHGSYERAEFVDVETPVFMVQWVEAENADKARERALSLSKVYVNDTDDLGCFNELEFTEVYKVFEVPSCEEDFDYRVLDYATDMDVNIKDYDWQDVANMF